jgi:hypothetical protein
MNSPYELIEYFVNTPLKSPAGIVLGALMPTLKNK